MTAFHVEIDVFSDKAPEQIAALKALRAAGAVVRETAIMREELTPLGNRNVNVKANALELIKSRPAITPSEIASILGCRMTYINDVITQLARDGLVRRVKMGRFTEVHPVTAGAAL